jgi:hypothetical protein
MERLNSGFMEMPEGTDTKFTYLGEITQGGLLGVLGKV